jgi:hypothetical protein
MKNLLTTITLCCALAVAGCSKVVSENPIGIDNYLIQPEDWNGTWLSEDEFMKIKVIDEAEGLFEIVWIEEKDDDFKLETMMCQLRQGVSGVYLNVKDVPGEPLKDYYYWGKIKKDKDNILFWLPSFEAFEEAYESNIIQAIVEKSDPDENGKQYVQYIKINDDPKKIVDLIESNSGKYFDLEHPIVLTKIK